MGVPHGTAMITAAATAADFSRWAELAKDMSDEALLYTIQDCRQAAQAMAGWNPSREGYYLDQLSTYAQELSRRARKRKRSV